MPIKTNELLTLPEGIKHIANQLADRHSFVITVPPGRLMQLADALEAHVPTWTAYLDNATGMVLRTPLAGTIRHVTPFAPTAAVVTVPKTVPAEHVSKAIGQHVPADGSQDIVVLLTPGEPTYFPMLFVNAMELVDPDVAATLRAHELTNRP